MHVVFFNRSFHPDRTATGQLLAELSESLVREHGFRVTVVTGPPLSPLPGSDISTEYHGVHVRRAWGTRFDKRRFAGRAANYMTYFVSACLEALRVGKADVIVALTDPPIIGLAALIASRWSGAPLVMSYQDLFPEVTSLLEDFHSDGINRALQAVNRLLVRRARVVVALGETMRRRLIEDKGADEAKTTIIPNWADTQTIVPGPKDNAFARAHGLARSFVVMYSGNMGLSQRLDGILDAAHRLRDRADIRFVFQGEGVRRAELEQRAAKDALTQVMFLPYAPKASLGESFATADVFVVPLQRGLAGYIVPSKLYGILAAGRPYIAAVEPTCEVAVVTREHGCGLLADPDDPADLANRILELYLDRDRASKMGELARTAALAYERSAQVQKYADLFRSVAPRAEGRAERMPVQPRVTAEGGPHGR
jgi:glycosyltransferase involved in cell wall biosynthesis